MQSYGPLGEPQKLVQVEPEVSPSRFLPAPAHRLVVLPSATEASPLVPPMLRPGPGSAARFIFIYTLLTCVHHRARPGASDARNQRDQGAEPLMHAPHPSAACAPAVAAARACASRSAAVSRGRAAAALRARRVQHAPARSLTQRALASWVATLALNFPWLPWLLWMDYGFPIFECAPRQRAARPLRASLPAIRCACPTLHATLSERICPPLGLQGRGAGVVAVHADCELHVLERAGRDGAG